MRRVDAMKITEMLRLKEMGFSQRDIAKSSGCGKTTVGDVMKRCQTAGVGYKTALGMGEDELHRLVYPANTSNASAKTEPDFDAIHKELLRHKNLNLQFMWEEYRDNAPDPLGYSQFCAKFREYKEKRDVTMHNEKKPCDELEVDWAICNSLHMAQYVN